MTLICSPSDGDMCDKDEEKQWNKKKKEKKSWEAKKNSHNMSNTHMYINMSCADAYL
jgi:hypothetical protein